MSALDKATATGIYETGLNELITGDQIKQIV